jgi:hypothetical protein
LKEKAFSWEEPEKRNQQQQEKELAFFTESATGWQENTALVMLLQLCSGGVCRSRCFLGYTAESSHPRMAALRSKRRTVLRGTFYIDKTTRMPNN